jgi:hypothetical protein
MPVSRSPLASSNVARVDTGHTEHERPAPCPTPPPHTPRVCRGQGAREYVLVVLCVVIFVVGSRGAPCMHGGEGWRWGVNVIFCAAVSCAWYRGRVSTSGSNRTYVRALGQRAYARRQAFL